MKKTYILAALLTLLSFPALATVDRIDPNAMEVTPSGSSTPTPLSDMTHELIGNQLQNSASAYSNQNGDFPTITQILGATATSITNAKVYPLTSGGPSTPVFDTDHFTFESGTPSIAGRTYPKYQAISSLTPSNPLGYGRLVVSTIINTNKFMISAYSAGFAITLELDGKPFFVAQGTNATAQAGASSTITLASSSSSVNGFYNQKYIYLTGGTGADQRKRITSYDGATKIATVDSSWSVTPDNTSTYIMSDSSLVAHALPLSGSTEYMAFQISGDRKAHLLRIYTSNPIYSLYVDSSGSIMPSAKDNRPIMAVVSDSFGEGTGSSTFAESYSRLMCNTLGFKFVDVSLGGTGFTTTGDSMNYQQRLAPQVNAWYIDNGGATAGTFTLTQSGTTTDPLAYNISSATLQTSLDSKFGSGKFLVKKPPTGIKNFILFGIGTNEANTDALTINGSGLTSVVTANTSQYKGDLDDFVPVYKDGNKQPFYIFLQGSGNDSANVASLTASIQDLIARTKIKYPQAKIILSGSWMNKGPMSGGDLTLETAIENAASSLNNINGTNPFIRTYNPSTGVGYLNGSTTVKAPSGTSGDNTDAFVSNDGTHPTPLGHYYLSSFFAEKVMKIMDLRQ